MTIEELGDKHSKIIGNDFENSEEELFEGEFEYWLNKQKRHTKLSIQFAIEVLKELNQIWVGDSKMIYVDAVQNKVQELKEYLNEEV